MSHQIKRRDLLLGATALTAVSLTSMSLSNSATAEAESALPRPHIVYIVADDLGWKDVGFHGADIKTPNIDKLAEGGARLEQFYVQPMCTPTRAALMTGRYPFLYGLQTLVIPTPSKYGLPTDERLLPQALKEAGYKTVMAGKWHLGHADRKFWPRQRGFDYHYGSMVGEVDYYTHLPQTYAIGIAMTNPWTRRVMLPSFGARTPRRKSTPMIRSLRCFYISPSQLRTRHTRLPRSTWTNTGISKTRRDEPMRP
jgi:hypothetical protein